MNYGLNGRIALVTGGDSGMGFQTAALLLQEGAKVFLTDRVPDRLEQAARQLSAHGTIDRKSTRLNSSHMVQSRMPSSA